MTDSENIHQRRTKEGNSSHGAKEERVDLDQVLINELGHFGRFQFKNIALVSIPMIMSAFMSEYIFSAAAIPHRCQIPECGEDSTDSYVFGPQWILNAVPETASGFASCLRFKSPASNGSLDYCPADLFLRDIVISCESYVYDRDNSVVYDFDLGCQEWIRALAGTLSSVGTLLALPITGYFSDRFGRRLALVVSMFNFALFGFIRAFSINYTMYLALQLLQTTFGAGTFSCAYIFAAELVGPKYRVLIGALSTSMYATGLVVLGSVAWIVQPWRYLILALHIPCFLIISYHWLLGESIRWLLSKQKFTEARAALEEVAKVNRTNISEKSMKALLLPSAQTFQDTTGPGLVYYILRSPTLLRRVCTTPFWWVTSTFVYHGLSINSTSLSDAMYLNFILTCAIEIPGNFTAALLLDRIGRKPTLSGGFFLSAACNIIFAFTPNDLNVLRLIVYLMGKFGISVVMTSLYLFTSELYPTEYRHSLLAFSSMIGRIGSISAPLTPALMEYWAGIPTVMFGTMGLIAGLLVLTQPDTLGVKMPDTLAEAEALGKPEFKRTG